MDSIEQMRQEINSSDIHQSCSFENSIDSEALEKFIPSADTVRPIINQSRQTMFAFLSLSLCLPSELVREKTLIFFVLHSSN
jgi:hypothetical protein